MPKIECEKLKWLTVRPGEFGTCRSQRILTLADSSQATLSRARNVRPANLSELQLKLLSSIASSVSMASGTKRVIPLALLGTRRSIALRSLTPLCPLWQQQRCAGGQTSANAAKYRRKDQTSGQKNKKKKQRTTFVQYDLANADQFSLCDAMRYYGAAPILNVNKLIRGQVHPGL